MIAILTGDIVHSRKTNLWLEILKSALVKLGEQQRNWEIYRGDSFQLKLSDPSQAFWACVYLKASIKTLKDLDVRMAIGIGKEEYRDDRISQSNGEAFVFSGTQFETLRKDKQNLAIRTSDEDLNETLNLCFKLALKVMDAWTPRSATLVKSLIEHPDHSQKEMGDLLGIKQSSVSEGYNRASIAEILELNQYFIKRIKKLADV